ncbi:hypothetical protein BDZ91DRAFT_715822 [Kalaharituber pfeilii]|nr:hypothetical protein BDZ91DRAFT_715822 [Kalaharituber pfeilii]
MGAERYIPPHRRRFFAGLWRRKDITCCFGDGGAGTLAGSVSDEEKITRLLIFENSHPGYPNELLVKSNLGLVFDVDLDELRKQEIPVYAEEEDLFRFVGFWRIVSVRKLPAGCEELMEHMRVKWDQRLGVGKGERTAQQWRDSLGVDWAVVGIEKVCDGMDPVKKWLYGSDRNV